MKYFEMRCPDCFGYEMSEKTTLASELETVINRHSAENGSDTPDFILAHYLMMCLEAFNDAVCWRERWYGRRNAEFPGVQSNTPEERTVPETASNADRLTANDAERP